MPVAQFLLGTAKVTSDAVILFAANKSSKGKLCAFLLSAGVKGAVSVPSLSVLASPLVAVANA